MAGLGAPLSIFFEGRYKSHKSYFVVVGIISINYLVESDKAVRRRKKAVSYRNQNCMPNIFSTQTYMYMYYMHVCIWLASVGLCWSLLPAICSFSLHNSLLLNCAFVCTLNEDILRHEIDVPFTVARKKTDIAINTHMRITVTTKIIDTPCELDDESVVSVITSDIVTCTPCTISIATFSSTY